MNLLFLGSLGSTEIIVILVIVLLLFGGRKIPELMRGLGKGVKEFKKGAAELNDDIQQEKSEIKSALKDDKKES